MTPLSARLEAVLALLDPCRMLVDVGTDHALIPLAAVERGLAQRALASDLRIAPLRAARRRIRASSVAKRVLLLREDGLSALAPGAVDAVVLAGMSGELMVRLCSDAARVLAGVTQLVLQPNSDAVVVRRWALHNGWHLHDERLLYERGQYFTLCSFRKGEAADPAYASDRFSEDALCLVGPHLLARKDETAARFAAWQCQRLSALVEQGGHVMQPELDVWQAAVAVLTEMIS